MRRVVALGGIVCLLAASAMAQDPVKVDAKHYRVEFENARVWVLHIQYGAHERSVMHHHPDGVAVFLADQDSHVDDTGWTALAIRCLQDVVRARAVASGGRARGAAVA